MKKQQKTVCAELPFTNVTFDRIIMIFYRICIFFLYLLCIWIYIFNIAIFKKCMIKVKNSHCLYVHKLYFNDSKLYQKWKKLQNSTSDGLFSTFKI